MNFLSVTLFLIVATISRSYGDGQSDPNNLLDIEPPKFYVVEPSPLEKREESFRSKEYFNFLNHLYRHDRTKSDLFEMTPGTESEATNFNAHPEAIFGRRKRAIIFRPLFVYRQQQVKRQKVKEERDRTRKPRY